MCGIIGFFNNREAVELVRQGIKIQKERGLDGFGISTGNEVIHTETIEGLRVIEDSKNAIGHNLHSIVGHVMQPFTTLLSSINGTTILRYFSSSSSFIFLIRRFNPNSSAILFECIRSSASFP